MDGAPGVTVLRGFLVVLLLFLMGTAIPQQNPERPSWLSREGTFRVSFTSRLQPIVINQIHSWVLHVETPGGEAVEGAAISVTGGMPAHDHGLPTEPEVTRVLGDGDYLVEGLRFHMNGEWELEIKISAGGVMDTAIVPLKL